MSLHHLPLSQLLHEVVVRSGPGSDGPHVPAGRAEITVEGDEVGQHHADRPADPGNTVDQHSPATLRLLSDDPGELGQVGEHVLRLRVL